MVETRVSEKSLLAFVAGDKGVVFNGRVPNQELLVINNHPRGLSREGYL